jgi:DNA-binding transcriptional MerR regulator
LLIGDVARRSGVSTRMLRHYDALGLVRPTGRTVGGYREYSAEDVRRIFHVESLRSLGLSLKQIGRALEDPAFTPSALVGDLIRQTEDRLAREKELLERLRAIDASTPTDWQGVLRIVELVRELNSTSAARRQQAVLARPEDASVPAELLAGAVLTESDPHVAGALRWALARSGGDGVATLRAGAHSEDAGIRRRAVLAIAEMPEAPGAVEVLADALGDPDTAVRRHAAWLWAGRAWPQPCPHSSAWWWRAATTWTRRRCWEPCPWTPGARTGSRPPWSRNWPRPPRTPRRGSASPKPWSSSREPQRSRSCAD